MAMILLDHADGRYSTRLLTEEETSKFKVAGADITYVQDSVYDAYLRHCAQDNVWQTLWQALSNEEALRQSLRHREKELRPLEEAQRQIDQLKNELERSEQMHHHFEREYLRATGRQTREEHDNNGAFTCIFPQPGCDISVLESAEWRAEAAKLLQKHNPTLSRYQGCCCGHTHRLLSPETAKKLRAAGFIVENDSESEE